MGYTVIYRSSTDSKTAEETAPEAAPALVFETIQISRNDDTGETFLQTRLRNISGEVIISLKGSVFVKYTDDSVETVDVGLRSVHLPPGEAIDPSPVALKSGEVLRASGQIERVEGEPAPIAKEEPNAAREKSRKPLAALIAFIIVAIGVVFALFIAPSLDHSVYVVSRMVYHGDKTTESVYTLDEHGNKIARTSNGKTTEFTIDDNGLCTHEQDENPLDLTIEETDSAGRPTKIKSHSSSANTNVHYEYDYYDSGVLKSKSTSATTSGMGFTTAETFNENGFMTALQVTVSVSGKTNTSSFTYTYDGDQAHPSGYTKIDEKGTKTVGTYAYDKNGCITQVTEGGKVKYEFEYTKVANPSLGAQILASTPGVLELSHL